MTARVMSALSQHPLATQAVGECAGALLEAGGVNPELLLISVTPPLAGALEDILGATKALLKPGVQIGVTSDRILTGSREVKGTTAISMCALWSSSRSPSEFAEVETQPGRPVVKGLRLAVAAEDASVVSTSISSEFEQLRDATGTLILLADSSIRNLDQILDGIAAVAPGIVVVGGSSGSSLHEGATRLCLDNNIYASGMVAALIPPEIVTRICVSKGHKPVGPALLATRVERNVIYELGGRPALEVVQEILSTLAAEKRAAARDALRIGLFVSPQWPDQQLSPEAIYCGVLGADKATGSVIVGQEVELGATVQFAVCNSNSATADLKSVLSGLPRVLASLVFSSRSRSADFFGASDHEAGLIAGALDPATVWGISCFECFGPLGSTSRVHDSAASLLLFADQTPSHLGVI